MTAETQGPAQPSEQKLNGIVREADDYYNYIRKKDANGTRLDVVVVSIVVWFAAFIVLGITSLALSGCFSPSAFSTCVGSTPSSVLFRYLLFSAGASFVISAASGFATYVIRRKRRSRFGELGALVSKMKGGEVSSEGGLHLMDAMHQAALVLRKRKVDSALEYGIVAFMLVAIIGGGLGSIVAGALAYLYFREKALREYEMEDRRYEDSKRDLLQSL
jgi:hypothetical protein